MRRGGPLAGACRRPTQRPLAPGPALVVDPNDPPQEAVTSGAAYTMAFLRPLKTLLGNSVSIQNVRPPPPLPCVLIPLARPRSKGVRIADRSSQ